MATLPSSLALTTIADGSNIVAADHRNNYTAIQTENNALLTILAAGATGQVLVSGGGTTVNQAYPPGFEIAYAEFTSNVTSTATTEGGAVQVVSSGAVTYDGTAVIVEFFSPGVTHSVANTNIYFDLFDSGSAVGIMGRAAPSQGASAGGIPINLKRKFTPSAGSHTYKMSVFTDAATATVQGGPAGAGSFMPGFIRITKA